MPVTRVEHAILLSMAEAEEPVPDSVLEWEGSHITYAGPATGAPPRASGEIQETIDGRGCVALPGLINAHTHLAMTLLRGFADDLPLMEWLEQKIWPTEMKLVAEDVYWGTRLGVLELLRGGCTCFTDMYHYYETATQASIDGGIRACPSGVLLGFLNNAEDLLAQALDFTVRMKAEHSDRIHPMLGPHAPYTCPDHLLEQVIAGAREQDIPVHIHLAETKREVAESRAESGLSPVRRVHDLGLFDCRVLAAHCVWLDDGDVDILVERQVGIAHCPGSNMKLASGFAPIPALLERGAIVSLGTDGAASNNNLDMFEEMLFAATIHKAYVGDPTAVKAREVLAMATREASKSLGLADIVGTLEPGKRADIALVDLSAPHLRPLHNVISHLVYAAGPADVKMTVVDGAIVMRDGRFPGQDAGEIYRQCGHRAARLCGD